MELHHDKHHATYVSNLNKALEGHDDLATLSIEELLSHLDKVPQEKRQAVINNGGGHANHSLFWRTMKQNGGGTPNGVLLERINSTFGTFDEFKKLFTEKAMTVFGSGWAFLVQKSDGSLELSRHSFQNSPIMKGDIPLLGLDVWEHAYYLHYQNRRAEYVESWWNVVNWDEVSKNLK
jgi:Fe-Mn family superoxide dismutase